MAGDQRTVADVTELLSSAAPSSLPGLIRQHRSDTRAGVQRCVEAAQRRLNAHRRETARIDGLYSRERDLLEAGLLAIAGVDEVGRGALAGPLTAAAVILPQHPKIEGLDDSKRLTRDRRILLDSRIRETAIAVSVAHVSAGELDAGGVTGALRRAVSVAVKGLDVSPDHVLMDGAFTLGVHPREEAIVAGDSLCAAIAAASIVAKVARDALMRSLDESCSGYGFAVNMGYGTAEHLEALRVHGPSEHHRLSFSPCAQQTLF